MIEQCEAQRRVEEMPWPEGKRPRFRMRHVPPTPAGDARFGVMIYHPREPIARGWIVESCSMESALRNALETWVTKRGLPLELLPLIARLSN